MPEPEKPRKKRISLKSFTQGVVAVTSPYLAYGARAAQHINDGIASRCDRIMGNLFYPFLPKGTQLEVDFLNEADEKVEGFSEILKKYEAAGEYATGIGIPWAANGLLNHGLEKITGSFKAAKETLSAAVNGALAYGIFAFNHPSVVEAVAKGYQHSDLESLASTVQQAGQGFFEGIASGDHRVGNLMALSFGAAALYNSGYKIIWKRIAKPLLRGISSP